MVELVFEDGWIISVGRDHWGMWFSVYVHAYVERHGRVIHAHIRKVNA